MNTLQPPRPSFKEQMLRAREDAIVEAASRLLGEKGFETMTVDEVAAAVGIAKASLYKHFAGKDDLCSAAMVHVVERLQRFLAALPAELGAMQRLHALLCWTLQLQLADEVPLLPSRNSALAQALRAYAAAEAQAAAALRACLPTPTEAGVLSDVRHARAASAAAGEAAMRAVLLLDAAALLAGGADAAALGALAKRLGVPAAVLAQPLRAAALSLPTDDASARIAAAISCEEASSGAGMR